MSLGFLLHISLQEKENGFNFLGLELGRISYGNSNLGDRAGSRGLAFSGNAMSELLIRRMDGVPVRLQKIIVFAFAGALSMWGCLPASLAADANRGQELAGAWCAACHVPLEERKPGNLAAPSFEIIADRSVLDVKSLSQQLLAPHPQMPDRALSRDEAADIAAYILSLRK